MLADPEQLAALAAVVEGGTFEAAARALHVTPSAVSQRIRALEQTVGQVVVQRARPCLPTPAGRVLLRLARQVRLASSEAEAALHPPESERWTHLAVALNADSLESWFSPVISEVARWGDTVLVLHVEDQALSAGLLRSGTVMAAVTSNPDAVQGCSVQPLGTMRYLAVASPEFRDRWFPRGLTVGALHAAPMVRFNDKDHLQAELAEVLVRRVKVTDSTPEQMPPTHHVPGETAYMEAVRSGLGWGGVPELHMGDDLETGKLVLLSRRLHLDVTLYWQRWRLESAALDRLTETVCRAAAPLRRMPRIVSL